MNFIEAITKATAMSTAKGIDHYVICISDCEWSIDTQRPAERQRNDYVSVLYPNQDHPVGYVLHER